MRLMIAASCEGWQRHHELTVMRQPVLPTIRPFIRRGVGHSSSSSGIRNSAVEPSVRRSSSRAFIKRKPRSTLIGRSAARKSPAFPATARLYSPIQTPAWRIEIGGKSQHDRLVRVAWRLVIPHGHGGAETNIIKTGRCLIAEKYPRRQRHASS